MAEEKNSFIAYCDWGETFDALPDAEAGMLAKHLFAYVRDMHPTTDNILINAVFANIKLTLKRDLRKYEKFRTKQSENGKMGGRPTKPTETQKTQTFTEEPKKAVSVSVSVNDNVNVNESEKTLYVTVEGLQPSPFTKKTIQIRKSEFEQKLVEIFRFEREQFYHEKEENKKFFDYWTEHGPKDLKMRFEKETSFDIAKRLDRWFENVELKRQKDITRGAEKLSKFEATIKAGEAGTAQAIENIKLRKQQEAI